MAIFSRGKFTASLTASGEPESTAAEGSITIGGSLTEDASGITSAYAFKVTATGATDEVTVNLATWVATGTVGSPTIEDATGLDFEGEAFDVLGMADFIMIEAPTTNSGAVVSEIGGVSTYCKNYNSCLLAPRLNIHTGTNDLTLTFAAVGDVATVVFLTE